MQRTQRIGLGCPCIELSISSCCCWASKFRCSATADPSETSPICEKKVYGTALNMECAACLWHTTHLVLSGVEPSVCMCISTLSCTCSLVLESFVSCQNIKTQKKLRRQFVHFLHPGQEYNALILHKLQVRCSKLMKQFLSFCLNRSCCQCCYCHYHLDVLSCFSVWPQNIEVQIIAHNNQLHSWRSAWILMHLSCLLQEASSRLELRLPEIETHGAMCMKCRYNLNLVGVPYVGVETRCSC